MPADRPVIHRRTGSLLLSATVNDRYYEADREFLGSNATSIISSIRCTLGRPRFEPWSGESARIDRSDETMEISLREFASKRALDPVQVARVRTGATCVAYRRLIAGCMANLSREPRNGYTESTWES